MLPTRNGCSAAEAYPAKAKFKFGGGRMKDMGFAADVSVGSEGRLEKFPAFLADAHVSALLRKGALEPLDGKLDFSRNCSHLSKLGAPLRSSVARFGTEGGSARLCKAAQSVSTVS